MGYPEEFARSRSCKPTIRNTLALPASLQAATILELPAPLQASTIWNTWLCPPLRKRFEMQFVLRARGNSAIRDTELRRQLCQARSDVEAESGTGSGNRNMQQYACTRGKCRRRYRRSGEAAEWVLVKPVKCGGRATGLEGSRRHGRVTRLDPQFGNRDARRRTGIAMIKG